MTGVFLETNIYSEILKKLGPIRNELMVFAVIGAIILLTAAFSTIYSQVPWRSVCGAILLFIGVFWLVGFAVFYMYAILRLPSSTQELVFANAAQRTLAKQMPRGRRR